MSKETEIKLHNNCDFYHKNQVNTPTINTTSLADEPTSPLSCALPHRGGRPPAEILWPQEGNNRILSVT
ncbi:hypothetical protein V2T44_10150 [Serratia ficaria]|uniref:hypothetical protein n=1 Tax=Serratia ficaria TaxID=61651 RepID=UPI002ED1E18B|nr:hypothetical protein [Serratia ficaria]